MPDIQILKDEITNDPLIRGYAGMTDIQVADDMNLINRPAEGGTERMLNYCIKNRSRTNNGADTTPLPLIGRLQLVADAALTEDPFGTTIAANQVSREMKTWARTFLYVLTSPTLETLDFLDTEVDTGYIALGPGEAVVWKTPDIDALKGFSQNQQSRGTEIGWGRVREGDVTLARAS